MAVSCERARAPRDLGINGSAFYVNNGGQVMGISQGTGQLGEIFDMANVRKSAATHLQARCNRPATQLQSPASLDRLWAAASVSHR